MAKKCLMEKAARLHAAKAKDAKRVAEGKKPLTKANVRAYNRCRICGRRHAYMRKFGVCRLCFRELSSPASPRPRGKLGKELNK